MEALRKKKYVLVVLIFIIVIAMVAIIYSTFADKTTSKDIMAMIVGDNEDAVISVGIWEDGFETEYLYTRDGRQDFVTYKYQIGSVTKTFTGALLAKEVYDGRISIDDSVGKYLKLNQGSYDPTFEQLVTHRSGLSTLWDDILANSTDIFKENFSREDMVKLLENSKVQAAEYSFDYSNFGTGLVGTTTANEIEPESSYQKIMNRFLKEQLKLSDTYVGGDGDFKDNYQWTANDEMMSAGAIVSTVPDLIEYGKHYITDSGEDAYLDLCTTSLANVDENYDIGYFWLIDRNTGVVWHNGELAYENEDGVEVGYQAFLGIDKKKKKVVVVLYNGVSYYDENALTDILGMLLMKE